MPTGPEEYSETAYLPGPGPVEYRHVKKATLSLGVFCSSYMSVVPKHAHVETCGLGKHCPLDPRTRVDLADLYRRAGVHTERAGGLQSAIVHCMTWAAGEREVC